MRMFVPDELLVPVAVAAAVVAPCPLALVIDCVLMLDAPPEDVPLFGLPPGVGRLVVLIVRGTT